VKNIAVILAGGSGNRFGTDIPKQFLKIDNKTILEYSIEAFQRNININEILVVSNSNFIDEVTALVSENSFHKVKKILNGGKERYHSSLSAINYISEECNLIFHDAVRPLVSQAIINNVIYALGEYLAINVAIPASDTILELSDKKNFIKNIPNREFLFQAQTPQAFKWAIIKKAYEIGMTDPEFKVTDDCGVVNKYLPEIPIFVVPGEQTNLKLTYPSDVSILKTIFAQRIII